MIAAMTIQENLQIKAENFAECDLISSLLQDSLVYFSFYSFHEEKKCFRLLLNRFCWEFVDKFEENQCHFRVHSGLYIYNVRFISIDGNLKGERYLNLLSLHASPAEVNLIFSGSRGICLRVEQPLIYLKDLHDKYPTPSLPIHSDLY
ncbi:MAG: DUF2948 family protein [Holosporaceae bacterium]|jgi:hypothetical protein|nr:DUF2948 family protein [Holosporaceae bacterium]